MKKSSVIDYLSCIGFKSCAFFVRLMPINFSLFLGRQLGRLMYCLDAKHRALGYANIKKALGEELSPKKVRAITKKFYLNFGQNIIEIFLIPLFDKKYLEKFIEVEGRENLEKAFKKGKGVILLGVHAGSWELCNVFWASLGFNYNLLVREQKQPRLNHLINSYRKEKGCLLIERKNQTRQLIEALKKNEAVGMTADQGGASGELVPFLGRQASMPSGAIKLALKYGAVILPGYYVRKIGPYRKIIIEPPFELEISGDKKADIRNNVARLARNFEKNVRKYPQEYLWTYKIWKYGREKHILILSDGKTGHLRQSQAVAKIIREHCAQNAIACRLDTVEVKIKNNFVFSLFSLFSGKYNYDSLAHYSPDIVISCGSGLAALNYLVSRENLSKSIVILRPAPLGTKRFDLVIEPEHDRPAKRKNICLIEGALNLIDEKYLNQQKEELLKNTERHVPGTDRYIGLLIGGDTKQFRLKKQDIAQLVSRIKQAAESLKMDLLVSTSRRTSKEVEDLLKQELKNYSPCKLLIIANEKNLASAVGGILALSSIVVTSPESISMISEAASSGKHVLVFEASGLSIKHQRFLNVFAENKYIIRSPVQSIGQSIKDICATRPVIKTLEDNLKVKEAVKKIL